MRVVGSPPLVGVSMRLPSAIAMSFIGCLAFWGAIIATLYYVQ